MKNIDDIFLQAKGKVNISSNDNIIMLKDLVDVYAEDKIKKEIEGLNYQIKLEEDKSNYLLSILSIIGMIKKDYPNSKIHVLGDPDILLQVKDIDRSSDGYKLLRVGFVCFLLFVGAATAIINFHSDVDMPQTQQTIYRIITGEDTDKLLLMQIPYSLGIGVGMAVFFNHFLKKRINKEPSPLEIEVYSYQQNLDQYIKDNIEKHNR